MIFRQKYFNQPMNLELLTLIDELQKEVDFLEKEMKRCAAEYDFVGAEAFRVPFFRTRSKLRVLKNLENPNYDQMLYLRSRIAWNEKKTIDDSLSSTYLEMTKDLIAESKTELSKLEKIKIRNHIDTDELIKCIEKVLSSVISRFTLIFSKKNVEIIVFKEEVGLKIKLSMTNDRALTNNLQFGGLQKLKRIGFEVFEQHAILKVVEAD